MSDLTKQLEMLKSKLEVIEKETFVDYKKVCEKNLKIIESTQDNLVKLNVRGQIVFISPDTILSCDYENVLQKEIKEEVFESYVKIGSELNNNSNDTSLFMDFDRKIFEEILNIMRHFRNQETEAYYVYLDKNSDKELFKQEIVEFFNNNSKILSKILFK